MSIRLLIRILLLLLLAGCSRPEQADIAFGVQQLPLNFDPRKATDAASERVNHLLYQGLVRFDEARKPQPDLADWERPEPALYRFRLRGNPRFDHGAPVTMRDAAATLRWILEPTNNSPHRSTLEIIDSIEVHDDRSLTFRLKRADPHFPSYLATGILPEKHIHDTHDFSTEPLGSGPFRLLSRDAGRVMLQRKSDMESVSLVLVRDPSVRVLKLLRGEIDLLQNDLPPSLVDYLAKQDKVELMTEPGSNFTYLGFNLEDPVTGDIRIRRAVAHAIDRDAILEYVFRNRSRPAAGLFPPEHWLGIDNSNGLKYDPDQARKLLRDAGYGAGKQLELTWKTSSDSFRLRLATIMQQQLADVGISVKIKSYDFGTFFGDIKSGNFQLYSLTWVGLKTPDTFRYIFHSDSIPPAGANRGRLQSPVVDRLIESAEKEESIDAQIPLYRQLQQELLRELPYVPLWYEDQVAAFRPDRITGYTLRQDGNYDGLVPVKRVGR